jgi:hypothetical protein
MGSGCLKAYDTLHLSILVVAEAIEALAEAIFDELLRYTMTYPRVPYLTEVPTASKGLNPARRPVDYWPSANWAVVETDGSPAASSMRVAIVRARSAAEYALTPRT